MLFDMHLDMRIDMCLDVFGHVCGHVFRRVLRQGHIAGTVIEIEACRRQPDLLFDLDATSMHH